MNNSIYKFLLTITVLLGMSACGGGGGGDTVQELQSVTGAMIGVSNNKIAGAVVTVTDAVGTTREVTTDTNGLYYIDVKDLKLPLFIVGTYTDTNTNYSGKEYSFVSTDKSTAATVTANLNKYTSLLVAGMATDSGVFIDAVEALDDTSRNLVLGVDYQPMLARIDEVFCSVFLDADGTPKGCEWEPGNNILTTSYVPYVGPNTNTNANGITIDKLNMLVYIVLYRGEDQVGISGRVGNDFYQSTLAQFYENTVPMFLLDPNDYAGIISLEFMFGGTIESIGVPVQLPTSNSVRGVTEYDGNFPMTQVFVDNLTGCPVESRNFVVTPGDNSETPVVLFADYQLEIDTSPELVPVVSRTTINPTDACRPYAFDYQFDYNMVIKKTQTGLVDGVPVWTYDVPACEQYSNKTLENILQETYQYTDVDFDLLFTQPVVETRPALHRYTESWPNSSVNFVYDSTCPMVASFAVTPISGSIPLTVSVDASASVGAIASYSWSTSDGQTATGLASSFTFNTAGTHSITLTIANSDGSTEEVVTKTVTVDPLPVAGFSWSKGASLQINLNGGSSTGAGIASYQWSTSDGQTATGQTVSFTFGAAASYSVTLTITDRNGKTSTSVQVVAAEEIDTSSCVTVGNRMWEVKTDDGGLRDVDNTYNWYDPSLTGYWEQATFGTRYPDAGFDIQPTTYDYVQSVNALNLCGYNNWRMPTITELESLVTNVTTLNTPHIDTRLFPNTTWGSSGSFWSGTSEDVITFRARALNFNDGITYSYVKDGGPEQVRLVRTVQ